jgi:hypothetical protein
LRRVGAVGLGRTLPRLVLILVAVGAAVALFEQNEQRERATERRALESRAATLVSQAMVAGAHIACLANDTGTKIQSACEKFIFASPETVATAVAFMSARLSLLADAQLFAGKSGLDSLPSMAGLRRSIELDRYGIAAHVLSSQDGCNAKQCEVFALLNDASVLKSNIQTRTFDAYVERFAALWNADDGLQPASKAATPAPQPQAREPVVPAPSAPPVSSRFDFPSAASIPPVSIMAAEPPLRSPVTTATQPATDSRPDLPAAALPVPPRRPQSPEPFAPVR